MGRVTISIGEEEEAILDEKVENSGEYESKSAFVRECIRSYESRMEACERVEELEADLAAVREERDRLEDQADRVAELETEVERLHRERRQLLEERDEKKELARYVEDERTAQERWRQAGIVTKTKWKLLGMPENGQQTAADSE